MKIAAFILSSVLLCLPQDPTPTTLGLVYHDGQSVDAQVLKLEGDSVRLKVVVLGGSMQVVRKLSDFTPMSVFAIEMAANPPKDFDSHFSMAKRAGELRLIGPAGEQCKAALATIQDPAAKAAKRTEMRAWAADSLEKMLNEACAEERLQDAQHCLQLLTTRLSDTRSEQQHAAYAASVQALEEKLTAKRESSQQTKVDAKARDQINTKLTKVQKDVADGDNLLQQAIASSRQTVKSTKLCEQAIESYKSAAKALQALSEQNASDSDFARTAATLGQRIHDHGIRAALHAANNLTTQSDFKGAMDWTNRVLAYDPNNAEAKAMVATIQNAQAVASGDWDWRWNVPGRGFGGNNDRRGRQ